MNLLINRTTTAFDTDGQVTTLLWPSGHYGGYARWEDMRQLAAQARAALADDNCKLILLRGGADYFCKGWSPACWQNLSPAELEDELYFFQHLLGDIAQAKKPVVAVVQGPCQGPAMEWMSACHWVIAADAPHTSLGFEERNLGLIPALGAIFRLPRYIGLQKALHVLISGRQYDAKQALALGLVQEICPEDELPELVPKRIQLLRKSRNFHRQPTQSLFQRAVERLWVSRRLILRQTSASLEETANEAFPAPGWILEVCDQGWQRGRETGLSAARYAAKKALEESGTQHLLQLRKTTLSRFELQRAEKTPAPTREMTILGGGKMGAGLTKLASQRGIHVRLIERNERRRHWLSRKFFTSSVEVIAPEQPQAGTPWPLIYESVDEDFERKQSVLQDAEQYLLPEGWLATNTSTFRIQDLAASLKHPEKLVGMHFFMPPGAMPLVEIIPSMYTSPAVIKQAKDLARQLQKVWIEVQDRPGFFCTRVLGVYLHEALRLLQEGADLVKVDYVIRQFGFISGPFTFMDQAGIPLVQKVLADMIHPLLRVRDEQHLQHLEGMVIRDWQGKSGGVGFYQYPSEKGRVPQVNREVYESLGAEERSRISTVRIQHRMVLALINEATRCLEDGTIQQPVDGDLGAVYGLGFPAFLGGPFRYADQIGLPKLVHMLEELQQDCGARFTPTALLREKVEAKGTFYRK